MKEQGNKLHNDWRKAAIFKAFLIKMKDVLDITSIALIK